MHTSDLSADLLSRPKRPRRRNRPCRPALAVLAAVVAWAVIAPATPATAAPALSPETETAQPAATAATALSPEAETAQPAATAAPALSPETETAQPAAGAAEPSSGGAAEPSAGAAEPSAEESVVRKLHEAILAVMKDAKTLGYEGRRTRLAPELLGSFDMDFMGSKAAGRHWSEFDPEQQQRWLEAFKNLTIANYAGRFDGYSGQHFVDLGEEPAAHDTVVVRTKLIDPGGDDVQLNYRLRKDGAAWRIIDIYMHGTVSELALRRAEYSSAIERDGLDKVIADINAKAADLSADSAN